MSFEDEAPPASERQTCWRAHYAQRDEQIGLWLREISELMSEQLANTDSYDDDAFQGLKHIHNRLWAMRWNFGFLIEEVRDGEAGK
jgi:hypothetical protein